MPNYEYKCHDCGQEFEIERRISDESGQECPECGFGSCDRQISVCSVHFKGGGWTNSALSADTLERNWLNAFKKPDDTSDDGISDKMGQFQEVTGGEE
jgi:putative FmdB family regulatory protein